jgi:hypothetical protein
MATYFVRYDIATALVSENEPQLDGVELKKLDKWLKFQELEDVQWESVTDCDYDECYSNEGFHALCEITEKHCLCDEIQPIETDCR